MKYEFGNATDKGCIRPQNEDSFSLYQPKTTRQTLKRGYLMVVCDGMGGAQAGKTASSMAAELIPNQYYTGSVDDLRNALVTAIQHANREIWQKAGQSGDLLGMGTTAVAAALLEGKAYIAHVGDSRCYYCNNSGQITQITEDHTMVQRMVNRGILSGDEAENHNEKHMLSRAVGVDDHVEVDITLEPLDLKPGDALVLCSDGLTNVVSDDEIQQIVATHKAQGAVNKLIQLAKDRGGPDNITIQIVKCSENNAADYEIDVTTIRTAPLDTISKPVIIGGAVAGLIVLSLFLLWLFNAL
jgi:serine/threonine protein phosphatase PrpC